MKLKGDIGLQDEVTEVNTRPLQLGAFVLSNKKRDMNKFKHAVSGFYTNDIYYEDTDSMYIGNKHSDRLDKAGLLENNRSQGKNDYK